MGKMKKKEISNPFDQGRLRVCNSVNDVTARFVDHFDSGIQLSTQNNLKIQRLSLIVT